MLQIGAGAAFTGAPMKPQRRKSAQLVRQAKVLDCMPAVAYLCENDELYTMRYISPTLKSVVGYAPEDFIDNRKHFAASIVLPDDLDVADEFAEAVAAARKPVAARYRLVRSNGKVFQALFVAKSVRVNNSRKAIGICGVLVDLTHVPSLQGKSQVLNENHPTRRLKANAPKKPAKSANNNSKRRRKGA